MEMMDYITIMANAENLRARLSEALVHCSYHQSWTWLFRILLLNRVLHKWHENEQTPDNNRKAILPPGFGWR